MEEMSKEEVARRVYGASYDSLSSWGQLKVDEIHVATNGKVIPPANTTLNDVHEMADSHRLATRVRILEEENLELWEMNTELQTQNAQMRQELNLPEDDTSL